MKPFAASKSLSRYPARTTLSCRSANGSQPAQLSNRVEMRPQIFGQQTEFHRSILEKCPRFYKDYQKPVWLFNNHAETIWGAWFRRDVQLELDREYLHLADNGIVTLDTPKTNAAIADDAPILLMLPGLAGGSECLYIRYAIQSAYASGLRPICFNSRGMASSPLTTAQLYSASYTEDLRFVVRHLHDRFPAAHVCAVGWSLGANILVNYLGEEGADCTLLCAASLCNPFNLPNCDRNWKTGFSQLYSINLARAMKKQLRRHLHLFKDYDTESAMAAMTVRGVDDLITRVTFGKGWESVDAYYEGSSSADRIGNVGIPLLCIQAEDDPICPATGIPRDGIQQNGNCVLVTTPSGGHLGWSTTDEGIFGAPWSDRATLEWISAVLQQAPSKIRPSVESKQTSTLLGTAFR